MFHTYPHTVLSAGGVPLLWLTKDHEGRLGVNADIRGPDMKLVARIRDNKFTLNQSSMLSKERPDFSTLKITDSFGQEALDVRYMNASTIRITGEFNYPGIGVFHLSPPDEHHHDNCSVDSQLAVIYLGSPSSNMR